ncbi:hypothetical protein PM082_000305 [Marasmius tenuissimus]|nr:hypothetical protein PM082_000305 [Marasmius tenuissimus]
MYFSDPRDEIVIQDNSELSFASASEGRSTSLTGVLSPQHPVQTPYLQSLDSASIATLSYPDSYGTSQLYHSNFESRSMPSQAPAFQDAYSMLSMSPPGVQTYHHENCLQSSDLCATSAQHHGFCQHPLGYGLDGHYPDSNACVALTPNPETASYRNTRLDGYYGSQTVEQNSNSDMHERMVVASRPQGELTGDGDLGDVTGTYRPVQSMGWGDIARQVGSEAITKAALKNRRNKPLYFCRVPRCTSKGFTQKHNFEYHQRSHFNNTFVRHIESEWPTPRPDSLCRARSRIPISPQLEPIYNIYGGIYSGDEHGCAVDRLKLTHDEKSAPRLRRRG